MVKVVHAGPSDGPYMVVPAFGYFFTPHRQHSCHWPEGCAVCIAREHLGCNVCGPGGEAPMYLLQLPEPIPH